MESPRGILPAHQSASAVTIDLRQQHIRGEDDPPSETSVPKAHAAHPVAYLATFLRAQLSAVSVTLSNTRTREILSVLDRVSELVVGDMVIDRIDRTVHVNGAEVPMTDKVFRILCCLAKRPDECVDREQLRREVWGDTEHMARSNIIDVSVSLVRRSLRAAGSRVTVIAMRGAGYMLRTND